MMAGIRRRGAVSATARTVTRQPMPAIAPRYQQSVIRYRASSSAPRVCEMRSRDRLAEFRQRCGSAQTQLSDDDVTLPISCDAVGDTAAGAGDDLQRVLQQATRLRGWLQRAEQLGQLAAALTADRGYYSCSGSSDQLEALTSEAAQLGAQVCAEAAALAAWGAGAGGAGAGGEHAAARRAARLQAAAARARLAPALARVHAALADSRGARLALLRKQLQLTNQSVTEEECEELLDSGNIAIFVDNVTARAGAARLALREAEARRAELASVEAALRDVRDLFRQLASAVHAQQDSLDRVEYWAGSARAHVDAGGRELLKGTVVRKKTAKKKLSLIVCVCAGAAVVLAVLVLT